MTTNPLFDLAQTWWDPNGPFATLHDINPCRIQFMQDHFNFAGQRVLDLGCGGGLISEGLAQLSAEVTGIDIESRLIEVAKIHAKQHQLNIDYHAMNIDDFKTKAFDVIVCMEMLEHVENPEHMIAQCHRLLKKGGMLFLSTIHRTFKAYLELILMGEVVLGLLPRDTHDYAHFIRPSELAQHLRKHGFRIIDIKGLSYLPVVRQTQLTDRVDVNYLMVAIRE